MATTHNCGIILSFVHLPGEVKANILHRIQVSSRFGRTECYSFKFIRWVVVGARFESPRNTGEQKNKNGALQCLPNPHYPHFPGPKPNYFYVFLSSKMVDLNICPTCTYPTSNTAILFLTPRTNFLGNKIRK